MGLPIEYHPAAENDVDEAVYYYARRVTALGAALHSEIEHVEHLVSEQPESGMPLRGDLRRYLLK